MKAARWGWEQHGCKTVQQLTGGTRGVEGTPHQRGREMLVSTSFFCFIQPRSECLEWSCHHAGWVSVIHLWNLQRFVSGWCHIQWRSQWGLITTGLERPFSKTVCLVMRHSPLIAYLAPNILELHDYASSYKFLGKYKIMLTATINTWKYSKYL